MGFPSFGSWVSGSFTSPLTIQNTNAVFVSEYTLGSSAVEYAVYDRTLGSVFIDFTTPNNGSNTVSLNGITSDYCFIFRLIGYPDDGFIPKVKDFRIEKTDINAALQTNNLGSDIQLSTSVFSKAYVRPYGSYYWTLLGSVSSDNGNTWTPIPIYGREFDMTSTLGSECIVRLVDTTGSVVLYDLDAYFHMSDVR